MSGEEGGKVSLTVREEGSKGGVREREREREERGGEERKREREGERDAEKNQFSYTLICM